MANITIELTSESSLISIPYNLKDMSLSSILGNDPTVIEGIVGEDGGAALLPDGTWVGVLTYIDPTKAYWLKLTPTTIPYTLIIDVGDNVHQHLIGEVPGIYVHPHDQGSLYDIEDWDSNYDNLVTLSGDTGTDPTDTSEDITLDCVPDECGDCDGNAVTEGIPYCGGTFGTNCCDCEGTIGGTKFIDCTGACGYATIDGCGVCGGSDTGNCNDYTSKAIWFTPIQMNRWSYSQHEADWGPNGYNNDYWGTMHHFRVRTDSPGIHDIMDQSHNSFSAMMVGTHGAYDPLQYNGRRNYTWAQDCDSTHGSGWGGMCVDQPICDGIDHTRFDTTTSEYQGNPNECGNGLGLMPTGASTLANNYRRFFLPHQGMRFNDMGLSDTVGAPPGSNSDGIPHPVYQDGGNGPILFLNAGQCDAASATSSESFEYNNNAGGCLITEIVVRAFGQGGTSNSNTITFSAFSSNPNINIELGDADNHVMEANPYNQHAGTNWGGGACNTIFPSGGHLMMDMYRDNNALTAHPPNTSTYTGSGTYDCVESFWLFQSEYSYDRLFFPTPDNCPGDSDTLVSTCPFFVSNGHLKEQTFRIGVVGAPAEGSDYYTPHEFVDAEYSNIFITATDGSSGESRMIQFEVQIEPPNGFGTLLTTVDSSFSVTMPPNEYQQLPGQTMDMTSTRRQYVYKPGNSAVEGNFDLNDDGVSNLYSAYHDRINLKIRDYDTDTFGNDVYSSEVMALCENMSSSSDPCINITSDDCEGVPCFRFILEYNSTDETTGNVDYIDYHYRLFIWPYIGNDNSTIPSDEKGIDITEYQYGDSQPPTAWLRTIGNVDKSSDYYTETTAVCMHPLGSNYDGGETGGIEIPSFTGLDDSDCVVDEGPPYTWNTGTPITWSCRSGYRYPDEAQNAQDWLKCCEDTRVSNIQHYNVPGTCDDLTEVNTGFTSLAVDTVDSFTPFAPRKSQSIELTKQNLLTSFYANKEEQVTHWKLSLKIAKWSNYFTTMNIYVNHAVLYNTPGDHDGGSFLNDCSYSDPTQRDGRQAMCFFTELNSGHSDYNTGLILPKSATSGVDEQWYEFNIPLKVYGDGEIFYDMSTGSDDWRRDILYTGFSNIVTLAKHGKGNIQINSIRLSADWANYDSGEISMTDIKTDQIPGLATNAYLENSSEVSIQTNNCLESCGGCNSASTCDDQINWNIYIDKEFFDQQAAVSSGASYLGGDTAAAIANDTYHTIKVITDPSTGLIAGAGETITSDMTIPPAWYDDATAARVWENDAVDDTSFLYYIDNIQDSLINADGSWYVFDWYCKPFNSKVEDGFTLQLNLVTQYMGAEYITNITDNQRSVAFDIINDHEDYACNNFSVSSNTNIIDEIDIRIDNPSTPLEFSKISGNFCADGYPCTPELIVEEFFPTVWISGTSAAPFKYEFDWPYAAGECSIELILTDAEIDANHVDANNNPDAIMLEFDNNSGAGFVQVGNLSAGFYVDLWPNLATTQGIFGTTIPLTDGGNPSDIHWVYTTGFMGGITDTGTNAPAMEGTYLDKTICNTGPNEVRIQGTDSDDFSVNNIRVTKHSGLCADESTCGFIESSTDYSTNGHGSYDNTNGWGVVIDNTVQDAFGSDNLNRCIGFGHCNEDRTLTRKGLISYDYRLLVNLNSSSGISAPFEIFYDILIEGSNVDIGNFIERYNNSPTRTMAVTGNRDEDNACCTPGEGSISCFKAEQVNFKLDTIGIPEGLGPVNVNLIKPTSTDAGIGSFLDEYWINLENNDHAGIYTGFRGYDSNSDDTYATLIEDNFWKVDRNDHTEFLTSYPGSPTYWPVEGGSMYTESFLLKHDGTIDSLDITFFSNNGHNEVAATIEDSGDGTKKVYATTVLPDGDTWVRAIDFTNVVGTFTWLAVKSFQLEKSPHPTPYHVTLDTGISTYVDTTKTGITLSGRILNSPLAFCPDDKILVDAVRGYGSDEYSSILFKDSYRGAVTEGSPSYDGTMTYALAGYYYPRVTEDDGWRTAAVTIAPSNIGENTETILFLSAKRYFHNIFSSDTGEQDLQQIDVNIIGINAPHIHFLNYVAEEVPQVGVQSTEALLDNPTLKWYDNIGDDLISTTYLSETDSGIFINRNDDFGVKSIGSVDFSTYEGIPLKQPRCSLIVDGIVISKEFSAYTDIDNVAGTISYMWDNLIDAVSTFGGGEYTARLSDTSESNPNSNLKTVLIEARKTGKEYDGVLGWTLDNNISKAMETEPTFNNIVNGESYPVVHVYEDFKTIELLLAASDIDKFSQIIPQVIVSDSNIEAEIITAPYYINELGISYQDIFSWSSYFYPFSTFVADYDSVDLTAVFGDYTHENLSHVNAKIVLRSNPETCSCFVNTEELAPVEFNDPTDLPAVAEQNCLSAGYIWECTPAENFNGDVDVSLRVTDSDSSYDSVIFKLVVHPVNDPPIIKTLGDTNLYMNNITYPNDINIRIGTSDVEETDNSNIHLVDAQIVDGKSDEAGSYCDRVKQAIALITNAGVITTEDSRINTTNIISCDGDPSDGTIQFFGNGIWNNSGLTCVPNPNPWGNNTHAYRVTCSDGTIVQWRNEGGHMVHASAGDACESLNEHLLPSGLWGVASCTDMVYCSTICYEKFGMGREHTEEFCGFADYAGDNIIDIDDETICNEDVISNTWEGSTSFRGGIEATCGTTKLDDSGNIVYETVAGNEVPVIIPNKTYVDLFYDALSYFGITMTTVDNSCDMRYSTYVNTDLEWNTGWDDDGETCLQASKCCMFRSGIEWYLKDIVGIDDDTTAIIRSWFCGDAGNPAGTLGAADPHDLLSVITNVALDPTLSVSVCNGGEMNGKVCTIDTDCPSYEVPNFLNFKNEDTAYTEFLTYSGFENLENYMYVNPNQNSVGVSRIRISAKDGGVNEDGKYTHKRTGYSTVKVSIDGKNQGPEGDLLKEEQASFGIVPDTYLWTINGNDSRFEIPTELTRGNTFKIYDYVNSSNKILDNCIVDGGRLNSDGECCNLIEETSIQDWYNIDLDGMTDNPNPTYYETEYIDELELYSEYFKGRHSRWCDIEFETTWVYNPTTTFTNDNVGGFNPPNSLANELDYTKSYIFKIIDVVKDYDNVGNQQDEDWFEVLGFEAGGNAWADMWNMSYREGWDTFGERNVDHPYGVENKTVFTSPLMEQSSADEIKTKKIHLAKKLFGSSREINISYTSEVNDAFKQLLSTGLDFKFEYPSIYKAIVYATDSYGIIGESWEALDLTNLVKFNQTVNFRYSPWQGLNVTMHTDDTGAVIEPETPLPNISKVIEKHDKDKRPSLGLWYYDDMLGNKSTDWFVRHGFEDPLLTNQDGTPVKKHPYDDVEGGDFTKTFVQEEKCNNPLASAYILGDETPGGCSHDGKWRGAFYYNWQPTPFLEFTEDTISFDYLPGYGPTEETVESTFAFDGGIYDSFNFTATNIFQVPETGRYTFVIFRDDGMEIQIDDVVVLSSWVLGHVEETFTVDLTAGNHNILVKGYENSGIAKWYVSWYVEECDDSEPDCEEGTPKLGSNGNHIPTTDTSALLTLMKGAGLQKGHVLNSEDMEDFYPDADVRNPISLGSSNAVLYKYYDRELQPLAYEETSAPLTAQVFFYLRSTKDAFDVPTSDIFTSRIVLEDEMKKGNMYVGFLDWGDGSDIEYDKEPFQLGHSTTLTHVYEESGIYEITGDMFRVKVGTGDDLSTVEVESDEPTVLGITNFKEFLLRINISKNPDVEGEFQLLGGTGYDFIPYNETTPIVSGISNYSLYKKQLNAMNGAIREWTDEETDSGDWEYKDVRIPIKYKFIGEKLSSELALATADEKLINPLVSAFTGSLASEVGLSADDDVIIKLEDAILINDEIVSVCDFDDENNIFTCSHPDSSAYTDTYDMADEPHASAPNAFKSAFKDCEDECIIPVKADSIRGFYDGNVDAITGNLVPDDDPYTQYQKPDGTYNTNAAGEQEQVTTTNYITPRLINTGVGTRFGELGDYLGDSDIGQVRYFDRPFDMWEMLGFDTEIQDVEIIISMAGRADGDTSADGGTAPHFNIIVNGNIITDGFIENPTYTGESLVYEDYTFTIPVNILLDEIEIKVNYDNNDNPGLVSGDRNLYVTSLTINGITFDENTHEDVSVTYNEGIVQSYNLPDGVSPGGSMPWDGNMTYIIPTTYLVEDSAIVTNHPGNPVDSRYWNNIIPEDYTIQNNRRGIGNLPPLPDDSWAVFFEVVFGWGSLINTPGSFTIPAQPEQGTCIASYAFQGDMDYSNFLCGQFSAGHSFSNVYCETKVYVGETPCVWGDDYSPATTSSTLEWDSSVQILYSQSDGDDISKIVFNFEGLELPTAVIEQGLGGVSDDLSYPFQATMSGNTLILEGIDSEGTGIPNLSGNINSELLINVPILFREDKFGFESIDVYTGDHTPVDSTDHYMYQVYGKQYPYMTKFFSGISGLIVNEASSQTWRPYCDDAVSITEDDCTTNTSNWIYPYYPVLPKINKIGKFDEERLGLMGEGDSSTPIDLNVSLITQITLLGNSNKLLIYTFSEDDTTHFDIFNEYSTVKLTGINNLNIVGGWGGLVPEEMSSLDLEGTYTVGSVTAPQQWYPSWQQTVELQLQPSHPWYSNSEFMNDSHGIWLNPNWVNVTYLIENFPTYPSSFVFGDQPNLFQSQYPISIDLIEYEEQIPFGSPNITWNEDDEYAPISLTTLPEQWINYSLIDIDFSKIEEKALSDVGPINNHGILIDDYKIHYDGDGGIKLDNQKPMLRTKLGKNKKDRPY